MKRTTNRSGKHNRIITAVAACLLLLVMLGSIIVYAEYTKSSSVKRVVAPYVSSGVLFSSNYMSTKPDGGSFNKRFVYTASSEAPATTIVTICNYSQGNSTIVYDQSIGYTLHAKLVVVDGGTKSDATAGDVGGKTVTLTYKNNAAVPLSSSRLSYDFASSTLETGHASTDECMLTFSAGFNDGTGVQLELWTTFDGSYQGITDLEGVFAYYVANESATAHWSGYVDEDGARGVASSALPSAYDGFNYVITGSGSGRVRLSWNTALVEPNRLIINRIFSTVSSGAAASTGTYSASGASVTAGVISGSGAVTWEYIEFNVDSEIKDRYDLQFYRSAEVVPFEDWATVSGAIQISFS